MWEWCRHLGALNRTQANEKWLNRILGEENMGKHPYLPKNWCRHPGHVMKEDYCLYFINRYVYLYRAYPCNIYLYIKTILSVFHHSFFMSCNETSQETIYVSGHAQERWFSRRKNDSWSVWVSNIHIYIVHLFIFNKYIYNILFKKYIYITSRKGMFPCIYHNDINVIKSKVSTMHRVSEWFVAVSMLVVVSHRERHFRRLSNLGILLYEA